MYEKMSGRGGKCWWGAPWLAGETKCTATLMAPALCPHTVMVERFRDKETQRDTERDRQTCHLLCIPAKAVDVADRPLHG
eukprot:COSAG03_NODE_11118_length_610_cov_1.761252_1_plen_79_part_10